MLTGAGRLRYDTPAHRLPAHRLTDYRLTGSPAHTPYNAWRGFLPGISSCSPMRRCPAPPPLVDPLVAAAMPPALRQPAMPPRSYRKRGGSLPSLSRPGGVVTGSTTRKCSPTPDSSSGAPKLTPNASDPGSANSSAAAAVTLVWISARRYAAGTMPRGATYPVNAPDPNWGPHPALLPASHRVAPRPPSGPALFRAPDRVLRPPLRAPVHHAPA